jgi:hypothetical protein
MTLCRIGIGCVEQGQPFEAELSARGLKEFRFDFTYISIKQEEK